MLAASSSSSDDGTAQKMIPFILDCIRSLELRPLTKLAEKGAKVTVMLPVITKHASEDQAPGVRDRCYQGFLEGRIKGLCCCKRSEKPRTHHYTNVGHPSMEETLPVHVLQRARPTSDDRTNS